MQAILDSCSGSYQIVKRIHTLFNQLYKWYTQHDCIKKNYSENIKVNVKYDPIPRNTFSSEEITKLWNCVKSNNYIPIVLMLIYSGVRISELLDLVHLEEQWFKIQASKTTAGNRTIPIADKVFPFWESFLQQSKCNYAV